MFGDAKVQARTVIFLLFLLLGMYVLKMILDIQHKESMYRNVYYLPKCLLLTEMFTTMSYHSIPYRSVP